MNEEFQVEDRSAVGIIGCESGKDDWWGSSDVKARGRIEGLVLLQVLCRISVIGFKLCHV